MPIPNDGWLESSDVTPMFPTLVWKLQLKAEFHQPMDERIRAALRKQGLPDVAAGQAWQSGHNLHQLDEFRDLVACVERGTRSVLRFLRIGYDAFEITGCWANVLAKGASHRAHSHPNNFQREPERAALVTAAACADSATVDAGLVTHSG